jgi:hypothetical protein
MDELSLLQNELAAVQQTTTRHLSERTCVALVLKLIQTKSVTLFFIKHNKTQNTKHKTQNTKHKTQHTTHNTQHTTHNTHTQHNNTTQHNTHTQHTHTTHTHNTHTQHTHTTHNNTTQCVSFLILFIRST